MFLVVAWDGADFDLLEPWLKRGELPVLRSLVDQAAVRRLESTRPPVTFPAWTSFLTAATPDRHGVADFTLREGYRLRFVNATDRRLPTVFSLLSAAGLRVGTYGIPATHPPEALRGFQVPGFDTPFGASPDVATTYPPELGPRLIARYGSLGVEGPNQVRIDSGWHAGALGMLLATIEKRTRIFEDLLGETALDCAMVHFMESDTVSHQFRQFCDPRAPHYSAGELSDAILTVYRALDAALGRLIERAGAGATVMLISDHGGAPSSDRGICWNNWLADAGFLRFRPGAAGDRLPRLKSALLRWVPGALHARMFSTFRGIAGRVESASRFAGIDWRATDVFSEEAGYQASFWLNLAAREPEGHVMASRAESILSTLERALMALRDPFDGAAVVSATYRRAQLYDGPYASRLPDLVADLRQPDGCVYSALPSRAGREPGAFRRLTHAEMGGEKGAVMPGAHSRYGICVLAGPAVRPGNYPDGSLADAGATLLGLHGVAALPQMNGRAWTDCIDDQPIVHEFQPNTAVDISAMRPCPYTRAEESLVAERLRALGYID